MASSRVSPGSDRNNFWPRAGALSALLAATVEETLIRGFLFRIVQMLGGTWIAILISSAFSEPVTPSIRAPLLQAP